MTVFRRLVKQDGPGKPNDSANGCPTPFFRDSTNLAPVEILSVDDNLLAEELFRIE
jgi:hypothetical protein